MQVNSIVSHGPQLGVGKSKLYVNIFILQNGFARKAEVKDIGGGNWFQQFAAVARPVAVGQQPGPYFCLRHRLAGVQEIAQAVDIASQQVIPAAVYLKVVPGAAPPYGIKNIFISIAIRMIKLINVITYPYGIIFYIINRACRCRCGKRESQYQQQCKYNQTF